MKKINIIAFAFALFITSVSTPHVTYSHKTIDPTNTEIKFNFELAEGDFVYQDYLNVACENPNITLSPVSVSQKAIDQYDTRFKENKKHLTQSFEVTCIAHHDAPIAQPVNLSFSYFQHSNKQITQENYTLSPDTQPSLATTVDAEQTDAVTCSPNSEAGCQKKCAPAKSWSTTISDLITDTDSLALRILLVILLGILMSLTPCIYPMIPITVGILQSQAGTSVTQNFLRAMAYTMGIATTFALLGLLAAFTGQVFGSIMANPIFICSIVAVLVYLAGSMMGLYEMYIPSFMQPKNNGMRGSSLFAAFLFGAASGTMASPCLSPGLVLLLTLVTTLASKFMGFLLLFAFGIGLSIPLLLIGTFSSSLNVLPRSGMWMVEIKRAFGLIMLMMCFYFLNNILPWHILLWMMSAFSLIAGIFYLSTLKQTHSSSGKYVKNILSVSLIAASVFIAAQAFKATIITQRTQAHWWADDYHKSINEAKRLKKLVFLDITAPYCSICKAIDAKLFSSALVREKICAFALPVKIDISQDNETSKHLKEKFAIMGAPVFIIINPENEDTVQRWSGELYEFSIEEFINAISAF